MNITTKTLSAEYNDKYLAHTILNDKHETRRHKLMCKNCYLSHDDFNKLDTTTQKIIKTAIVLQPVIKTIKPIAKMVIAKRASRIVIQQPVQGFLRFGK